jgi:hypothetical protein
VPFFFYHKLLTIKYLAAYSWHSIVNKSNLLNFHQLNNSLKPFSNTTCHIICSGPSLNVSAISLLNDYRPKFTIGFNYACYANLTFDLYFFEFCGFNCLDQTIDLYSAFKGSRHRIKRLIFKNLLMKRNSANLLRRFYGDRIQILMDLNYSITQISNLSPLLESLFVYDHLFLRQYKSTAVSLIVLAYHAGFKSIVLHGLDFGGGYFFNTNSPTDLSGDQNPDISFLEKEFFFHPTAVGPFSLQVILPLIKNYLSYHGVTLLSATSHSPSSKILPVYYS